MPLLEIEGLAVDISGLPILKGIDLTLDAGETLGLVGESGSGKSMTALAVMRLLPDFARASGRIALDGTDILAASEAAMNRIRGASVGMVFQEPMTALNPVKRIGEQVSEGIRRHTGANRSDAEARARRMLERVGLPVARFPLSRFPHELSGGQRQRVVIAIACALKPKLLIADEPTTALDVVLQKQILELLRGLVAEDRMGLLLISHDLAVVADMADRVAIMRRGEVVDGGATAQTLSEQRHPYTRQLAEASVHRPKRATFAYPSGGGRSGAADGDYSVSDPPAPSLSASLQGASLADVPGRDLGLARPSDPREAEGQKPLLQVADVSRDYGGHGLFKREKPFRAVDNVSFSLAAGQSTALVGRSGCGKSTLARMILALDRPTSGAIRFIGEDMAGRSEKAIRHLRRNMQVVFQDPYGSFDPRLRVEKLVAEPLHLLDEKPSRDEVRARVAKALAEVGLGASDMDKYPHEFSGGQRQRISIARAVITEPKLIVCDEPVSALDVSIRAQVLDLFADLNQRLGVAYLFITHDLTVARAITDDVLVMADGVIVERGPTGDVLDNPRTEAAKALVEAAPDLSLALARRLERERIRSAPEPRPA